MKIFTTISLILATFTFIIPVYAGSGHAHDKAGGHSNHGHSHGPVSADKAKTKGKQTMLNLVKRGVIDKSWSSTKVIKAEKKVFAKGEEWVVSFINEKIEDKSKKILYIFFSLDGRYIAANYTGK